MEITNLSQFWGVMLITDELNPMKAVTQPYQKLTLGEI